MTALSAATLWRPAPAIPLAIESVLISKSAGVAEVEVRFSCPNRYLVHAPLVAADHVDITLMRMERCAGAGDTISEATQPPGRALAALVEIEYRLRAGADALLRLRFDRMARVAVSQGGDQRHLRIRVEAGDEPVTPALSGPSPPSTSAAAVAPLSAAQLARAEARARVATQAGPAPPAGAGLFAINLRSSLDAIDPDAERTAVAFPERRLYVDDMRSDEQVWHRLRLGFFDSETEAHAALESLRARYPGAWVTSVSPAEREAAGMVAGARAEAAVTATAGGIGPGEPGDAQRADVMSQARDAIVARDFPRAIQLTTRVLAEPGHADTADARELLGLARERNGQVAHAVAEYRRYLQDYPQSDGAARVGQRLAALTTARDPPKQGVRGAVAASRPSAWDVYGGVSQYYRRDSYDFGGDTVDQAALFSDADVVIRRDGERFDFGSRTSIGHALDMSGGDEGPGDEARLYNMYVDLRDRDLGWSSRLGRQTLRNQGALGRFDGALVGWDWTPAVRLNFLSGFPVYNADDSVQTDRLFYGVSVDLLDLAESVDVNLFFNSQDVDGLEDRQAAGGELRFLGTSGSLVTAVDFDLGYSELNSLVALGNWTFDNELSVNAMLDWRKTPYLTTENALIGQPAASIDELLRSFTEDEIRDLAADRTGSMQTAAFGVARPVSARFQVSADVTLSKFEGTPASGGVPATPDSDLESYWYVSLVGSSLLTEGDVSILGLRYADGTTARTTAMFLDTRYPLTSRLRLNPRLMVSRREMLAGDATELLLRPGLRLFYRMGRNYQFELDVGGEFGNRDGAADTENTTAYYMFLGYRADF